MGNIISSYFSDSNKNCEKSIDLVSSEINNKISATLDTFKTNIGTKSHIKYLWKKQKYDMRDKHNFFCGTIKINVDLRQHCPNVYDQETIGSCTANAICGAYEYDYLKSNRKINKLAIFSPSRLFLYYNEREMENTTKTDSGAEIRDGIKSINKVGLCSEKEWPYDIKNFDVKPNNKCYKDAKKHESVVYGSVKQTLEQLKSCLSSGYPFVFGFVVYESFESDEMAKTGIMTMPTKDDKKLGGHAVMAVGYNNSKKTFIIRNSWGKNWGDNGYFYMPYEYMLNSDLCSDFWMIQIVK